MPLQSIIVEQLVVILFVGGRGNYPRSAHGHAARVPLGTLAGLTSGLLGVVVHEAAAWRALRQSRGNVAGPDSAEDTKGRVQAAVVEVKAWSADVDCSSLDLVMGGNAGRWYRWWCRCHF